ncbi:phosphoribosyltransferase family protein [Peptococcaceae bacterium 1198_IL3148]
MTTQALSMPERRNYNILANLSVEVEITANPFHIPIDDVFAMAARNNPKRSYLFVSKLIGKHIPVLPGTPRLAGRLLATRLAELLALPINQQSVSEMVAALSGHAVGVMPSSAYKMQGKALFIGFAETATGLGHAVFDCFAGDVEYLHTTREPLCGAHDTIYFTEDHCHAPDQKLLVNNPALLQHNDYLVLIDDEISTGNLCLNIIRSIHKKYPQQHYVILSLLDWRSSAAKQRYQAVAAELGVKISVLSLIAGTFADNGTSPVIHESPQPLPKLKQATEIFVPPALPTVVTTAENEVVNYFKYTGRFGIDQQDNQLLKEITDKLGKRLTKLRHGQQTLCLGTGEFMHIPFMIAEAMGKGVVVQSTTRSPVHPINKDNYGVKHALTFKDPHNAVSNFVYNIPPNRYDEVFVFWERPVLPRQVEPLLIGFQQLGIKHVVFVWMT